MLNGVQIDECFRKVNKAVPFVIRAARPIVIVKIGTADQVAILMIVVKFDEFDIVLGGSVQE